MTEKINYFASEAHILAIRRVCGIFEFAAPPAFEATDTPTLRAVYNGIGPDRWSTCFRRLVTFLLTWFEAAALIHDWEYTFMPKTYSAFTAANWRFARNVCREAFMYFRDIPGGWRMILRRTAEGLVLALLCQLFGWKGFLTAKPEDIL
ncbi:MAG: hypothetical protein AB7F40_04265 [Victivallaceae bacterium]